jgi:hypothetical protein
MHSNSCSLNHTLQRSCIQRLLRSAKASSTAASSTQLRLQVSEGSDRMHCLTVSSWQPWHTVKLPSAGETVGEACCASIGDS